MLNIFRELYRAQQILSTRGIADLHFHETLLLESSSQAISCEQLFYFTLYTCSSSRSSGGDRISRSLRLSASEAKEVLLRSSSTSSPLLSAVTFSRLNEKNEIEIERLTAPQVSSFFYNSEYSSALPRDCIFLQKETAAPLLSPLSRRTSFIRVELSQESTRGKIAIASFTNSFFVENSSNPHEIYSCLLSFEAPKEFLTETTLSAHQSQRLVFLSREILIRLESLYSVEPSTAARGKLVKLVLIFKYEEVEDTFYLLHCPAIIFAGEDTRLPHHLKLSYDAKFVVPRRVKYTANPFAVDEHLTLQQQLLPPTSQNMKYRLVDQLRKSFDISESAAARTMSSARDNTPSSSLTLRRRNSAAVNDTKSQQPSEARSLTPVTSTKSSSQTMKGRGNNNYFKRAIKRISQSIDCSRSNSDSTAVVVIPQQQKQSTHRSYIPPPPQQQPPSNDEEADDHQTQKTSSAPLHLHAMHRRPPELQANIEEDVTSTTSSIITRSSSNTVNNLCRQKLRVGRERLGSTISSRGHNDASSSVLSIGNSTDRSVLEDFPSKDGGGGKKDLIHKSRSNESRYSSSSFSSHPTDSHRFKSNKMKLLFLAPPPAETASVEEDEFVKRFYQRQFIESERRENSELVAIESSATGTTPLCNGRKDYIRASHLKNNSCLRSEDILGRMQQMSLQAKNGSSIHDSVIAEFDQIYKDQKYQVHLLRQRNIDHIQRSHLLTPVDSVIPTECLHRRRRSQQSVTNDYFNDETTTLLARLEIKPLVEQKKHTINLRYKSTDVTRRRNSTNDLLGTAAIDDVPQTLVEKKSAQLMCLPPKPQKRKESNSNQHQVDSEINTSRSAKSTSTQLSSDRGKPRKKLVGGLTQPSQVADHGNVRGNNSQHKREEVSILKVR